MLLDIHPCNHKSHPKVRFEHVLDDFCRRTSGPSGYVLKKLFSAHKIHILQYVDCKTTLHKVCLLTFANKQQVYASCSRRNPIFFDKQAKKEDFNACVLKKTSYRLSMQLYISILHLWLHQFMHARKIVETACIEAWGS